MVGRLLRLDGYSGGGAWGLSDLPVAEKGGQETLEKKVGKPRAEKLYKQFEKHGFMTVFTGAILPPPFPFTSVLMAAGVMQCPRKKFFSALTAGRALRFLPTPFWAGSMASE